MEKAVKRSFKGNIALLLVTLIVVGFANYLVTSTFTIFP